MDDFIRNLLSEIGAKAFVSWLRTIGNVFRHRDPLALDRATPLVLVVADLPITNSECPNHGSTYVAAEDLVAVNAVEMALARAGWDREQVELRLASRFDKDDPRDHQKNIFTFGSSKKNPVTKAFMEELNSKGLLEWTFVQDDASGHWRLSGKGTSWPSPSYAQEEILAPMKRSIWEGPADDHALLARAANPWNTRAKVYVVAGIRGIGTRGAGEHLCDHLQAIRKLTKGRGFAWLLWVKVENCRVKQTRRVLPDSD